MVNTQNRAQVLSLLKLNNHAIVQFGMARLGLFGSFVRDEAHEGSDVDIGVEFEKDKKTYKNFIRLTYFLEDLLHREVEVVIPEGVSPFIKPHILKELEYVSLTD
jgi:uncharacterized protein